MNHNKGKDKHHKELFEDDSILLGKQIGENYSRDCQYRRIDNFERIELGGLIVDLKAKTKE